MSKSNRGFTLVEMMVVLAIICILAVISVPVITSLMGAKNLDRGTYDLAGVIEQARDEAVTRQTYVWLGITPVQTSIGMEIQVAMVCSKDGTGTNTAQSNLTSLSKIIHISSIALTKWSSLKASTQNLFTNAIPASVSTNTTGISFTVGQTQFTGTTLTFTPGGEVLLKGAASSDDGFNSWIDVSLQQAHGTTVSLGADDASVLIEGATGAVKIVCLQ
jgi:prepilin-type N-terminal cleavage/methylation domain-containing protein